MNYTLHQLRVFIEIAKHQSLTKAAESLYLSQPAISIQLKKLQEQFDVAITETIGKKIHLTDFGNQILNVAKEITNLAEDLDNLSLSHNNQIVGKIKLSSVSTGKYVIPYFIADFIKENDAIDLQLDVTNRDDVIYSLAKNEVDFALVSIPPDKLKFDSLELFKNKVVLVVPYNIEVNHDFSIFEKIPLIYREHGSGTRKLLERFIVKQKIKKLKMLELQSNEAVKQAVIAGLGMSIIPLVSIRNELKLNQLKIISIDGLPLYSTWRLIWPKGKKHGIAAQKLLEYIAENKEDVIKEHFKWISEI